MSSQIIFQEGEEYFLIDIYDNGKVTLKRKVTGWGDTWSLPLEEAYDHMGKRD